MFFRFFLSVHFFFPKSSQFEKQITNLGSQKIFFERKFWRKNQTSRFRVSKRHILHSIPQTMFALSAQSFAVSARCARLISHPISSRRCPIFFSFDWMRSFQRGALSLSQNFFERRGQKTRQKAERGALFLADFQNILPLKFRSVKLTAILSSRAGTPSSTENKLPRERLWKLERRCVPFFSSRVGCFLSSPRFPFSFFSSFVFQP